MCSGKILELFEQLWKNILFCETFTRRRGEIQQMLHGGSVTSHKSPHGSSLKSQLSKCYIRLTETREQNWMFDHKGQSFAAAVLMGWGGGLHVHGVG